jgi:hypothetical protein
MANGFLLFILLRGKSSFIINKTLIFLSNRDNQTTDCLYDIYSLGGDISSPKCGMEINIRMILEQQIGTKEIRSNTIKVFSDLTHVNVFQRTSPTLFYIHKNSTFTLISNKNIIIIPVNM